MITYETTYQHAYKIRLYPNSAQKELIEKFINAYRAIYNWGIEMERRQYELWKENIVESSFLNFYDLCTELSSIKEIEDNKWIKDIPNSTARLALQDVVEAFRLFFKHFNRAPKFKSKKRSPKMFRTRNDRFYIDGDRLRFEGLTSFHGYNARSELVKLKFNTGFKRLDGIKYIRPTIYLDNLGNYWALFIIIEKKQIIDKPKSEPIGIDLGIRHTITLSTNEVFDLPNDKLRKLDKKSRKLQRRVSRDIERRKKEANRTRTKYDDIPISKRAQKRMLRANKVRAKIKNIKEAYYKKVTHEIVGRNPRAIVVEKIGCRNMEQLNKHQPREVRNAIHHANFYKIRQIIKNQCNKYSVDYIEADQYYPSSQICSNCGHRKKMNVKQKIYKCSYCGLQIDRDINAALNLRNLACNY